MKKRNRAFSWLFTILILGGSFVIILLLNQKQLDFIKTSNGSTVKTVVGTIISIAIVIINLII